MSNYYTRGEMSTPHPSPCPCLPFDVLDRVLGARLGGLVPAKKQENLVYKEYQSSLHIRLCRIFDLCDNDLFLLVTLTYNITRNSPHAPSFGLPPLSSSVVLIPELLVHRVQGPNRRDGERSTPWNEDNRSERRDCFTPITTKRRVSSQYS